MNSAWPQLKLSCSLIWHRSLRYASLAESIRSCLFCDWRWFMFIIHNNNFQKLFGFVVPLVSLRGLREFRSGKMGHDTIHSHKTVTDDMNLVCITVGSVQIHQSFFLFIWPLSRSMSFPNCCRWQPVAWTYHASSFLLSDWKLLC